MNFVQRTGVERILSHELQLMRKLYRYLRKIPQVVLYTPEPDGRFFAPVFSFNVKEVPSETVGTMLAQQGIAVRAGLHCAPAAHKAFGTEQQGAVRVCPSAFTSQKEIEMAGLAIGKTVTKCKNMG